MERQGHAGQPGSGGDLSKQEGSGPCVGVQAVCEANDSPDVQRRMISQFSDQLRNESLDLLAAQDERKNSDEHSRCKESAQPQFSYDSRQESQRTNSLELQYAPRISVNYDHLRDSSNYLHIQKYEDPSSHGNASNGTPEGNLLHETQKSNGSECSPVEQAASEEDKSDSRPHAQPTDHNLTANSSCAVVRQISLFTEAGQQNIPGQQTGADPLGATKCRPRDKNAHFVLNQETLNNIKLTFIAPDSSTYLQNAQKILS